MPGDEQPISGTEELRAIIQEAQNEQDQIQKELGEIDVLIRQSTAEVEKLAQRSTQLANRVRQMEMNLETYPREDIRELYAAGHEAHMRVFMMRGQLEQQQNRQQSLERRNQRLARLIELASQIAPADLLRAPDDGLPTGQSELVRVIEAQENERQRLARQMHDGPAQSLTNLMLQAEICERLFDTDPLQARVELGNLKNATNTTFQKIRDFILTLRPMMLDDLGLMPTVKQYVQDYGEKTELATNLTVIGREMRLPSHVEVALFRMLQELLANVHTHAHATHAQVTLGFGERSVSVSVEDDGSGFDVSDIQSPSQQRKGLGLQTIQERAEMLGGHVQIESRIGRGTRIRIELPVV